MTKCLPSFSRECQWVSLNELERLTNGLLFIFTDEFYLARLVCIMTSLTHRALCCLVQIHLFLFTYGNICLKFAVLHEVSFFFELHWRFSSALLPRSADSVVPFSDREPLVVLCILELISNIRMFLTLGILNHLGHVQRASHRNSVTECPQLEILQLRASCAPETKEAEKTKAK